MMQSDPRPTRAQKSTRHPNQSVGQPPLGIIGEGGKKKEIKKSIEQWPP